MASTTTVRLAKLRPGRADRYPTLPASMWTSAARVADLVAAWLGTPGKSTKLRTLSEDDFEFRGGSPRRVGGSVARTRTGELAPG